MYGYFIPDAVQINRKFKAMKRKRIENYVLHMNEELGKGSFGKVYKGVNETTKQIVAIKCLAKKMSTCILMYSRS
jgi:serine/threonine protein kinase